MAESRMIPRGVSLMGFKTPAKMWIVFLFALLGLLSITQVGLSDQAINLDSLQDIENVVFLQEDIIGGGVPSQGALEEIKRQGFKSVIDLRTVMEGTIFEKMSVKELGIKYFNIPIKGLDISEEEINKLAEILEDPANRPALLHCAVGGRVDVLWEKYKGKGFQ